MKIDLEILSTELLKPSKPTPQHLKCFKRSLLDQFSPSTYIPLNLFFTNDAEQDLSIPKILNSLKNSLSETLTLFYPFAGRFKDHVSIDCNDEGVIYREARAGCKLLEILEQPDIALLGIFVPCKPLRVEVKSPSSPLFGVQVNVFQCGGIVIGISFSHLIADAISISTFLKSWANTAKGFAPDKIIHPDLASASTLFPPRDPFPEGMWTPLGFQGGKHLTSMRRFVFNANSLRRLKEMVAANTNPNPTRVQALTALLWERYNFIVSKVPLGVNTSNFPSIIQSVNIRPRVDPPLSDCSIGNLLGMAIAKHEPSILEESSAGGRHLLPELAERVKKSFDSVDSQLISYLQHEQGFDVIMSVLKAMGDSLCENTKHSNLNITSWCNIGFYEVDFGWGKPIWIARAAIVEEGGSMPKSSGGVFYDAGSCSGGGIEAWLLLPEEQMAFLENDPMFLEFALLNPSVIRC